MAEQQQTGDTMVDLRDVVFCYDRQIVLDHCSMRARRGSVVALMGPSGVGKSTVLRLITGQHQPESGSVEVAGQRVSEMSRKQLHHYRRRLGVLLQNGALFTDLSCFENVAVPIREHTKLPEPVLRRLVLAKLHTVGLRGAAGMKPRELSGGMARRVALARALALDPSIVLYDEPFTGLDPIAVATIRRMIRHVNSALGLTSIIVTHNVEEAAQIADYAYIMVGGRIAAEGSPEDLEGDSSPAVRQFLNGEVDGPVPFHYPAADLSADLLA